MILCANLLLGAICTENLNTSCFRKWQQSRFDMLSSIFDASVEKGVSSIIFVGQIFGRDRVPESVIDTFFDILRSHSRISSIVILNADEYGRINYRNDLPDNLFLLCNLKGTSLEKDCLRIDIENNLILLKKSNRSVSIIYDDDTSYQVVIKGEELRIPSLEPTGFEDLEKGSGGYAILDWNDIDNPRYITVEKEIFSFKSIEVKLRPEDEEKDIIQKINGAVAKINSKSFLRITLTGKSAFGLTIDGDILAKELEKRFFFVEVFDNTIMDIQEDSFENDISLRSEFVRLALQDESLSETERNRLISYGWKALTETGRTRK